MKTKLTFLVTLITLLGSNSNLVLGSTKSTLNPSLKAYLTTITIPPKVKHLAERGFENYKKGELKKQLEKIQWDTVGGGRSGDWILKTFGQSEAKIIDNLKKIEAPSTWNADEIDITYQKAKQLYAEFSPTTPTFTLVENVGINGLHLVPLGQNAIVQLASQFNYLESPGPYKVSVSAYLDDHTQGPLGAIEAAAASLHRYAAEDAGILPHALHALLPRESRGYYQNGYLMLNQLSDDQCHKLQNHVENNIGKLEILPQWVMCESSGAYQLQVFAAAPSFQGSQRPSATSCAGTISTLLVTKQYEMIAQMAVIRSLLTNQPVPLHLTLVGQGVFNNPPSIMEKALNLVAETVKSYNVHVYIHVYGNAAKQKLLHSLKQPKFHLKHMTREQFKKATLGRQSP